MRLRTPGLASGLMIKIYSAGGIVTCDNKILLVREGNFFGFAKGRLETGEDPQRAAEREITEETGLQPSSLTLVKKLGVYERHPYTADNVSAPGELKHITMFLFSADTFELGTPSELDSRGVWMLKDDVYDTLTHPQDKAFYRSIESVL